jgi:hypothetical protein
MFSVPVGGLLNLLATLPSDVISDETPGFGFFFWLRVSSGAFGCVEPGFDYIDFGSADFDSVDFQFNSVQIVSSVRNVSKSRRDDILLTVGATCGQADVRASKSRTGRYLYIAPESIFYVPSRAGLVKKPK